jgi:hypothetical protein
MNTSTEHFTSGKELTVGETLHPAMNITDAADAARYLAAYEAYLVNMWQLTPDNAHATALSNLGYFAGYFSAETRDRVYELFHAAHPIFGTSHPTAEEAFQAGKKLGAQS